MKKTEAIELAIKKLDEEYRNKIIKSFEEDGATQTSFFREGVAPDEVIFYYGVPVMEKGKLIGFDMMKFVKIYGADGVDLRKPEEPYKDEKGNPIRFSIDEYIQFEKRFGRNQRSSVREKEIRKLSKQIRRNAFWNDFKRLFFRAK